MSTGRGILQTDAGGANIRVRLRGEDSEGELAVIEEVLEADFEGPPLHVYPSFEEGFYVLKGELTFRMEDETVSGGHGTIVFAPRGVPHTFANLSGRRARALILCAPAGFERYFEWLAGQQAGVEPPHERPPAGRYTRVVGPQIGAE